MNHEELGSADKVTGVSLVGIVEMIKSKIEEASRRSYYNSKRRKQSKWIKDDGSFLTCDNCGWKTGIKYEYCPRCNARMDDSVILKMGDKKKG